MDKRKGCALIAAAAALCLAACGARSEREPAPTPEPTVYAAPEPSPEPTPVTELRITDESFEEILALSENSELKYVDARGSREYDALLELSRALPGCAVEWSYTLCGREVGSLDTELVFEEGDPVSADELLEGLRYLPALERVDLLAHDMREPDMALLTEEYPEKRFIWHVSFGRWTVRSDITCFSTLQPGPPPFRWTDEDLAPLFRYCTDLRALDVGHNDLRDLTPLTRLKDLEVLILIDQPYLVDASPIGELENLTYLEFYMNYYVKDFSFVEKLTKMRDLNISYARIDDLSLLDGMPELRMAWVGFCNLTAEEIQSAREKHPDAEICAYYGDTDSSTAAGWRASEQNIAIRKAFWNWQHVVSFNDWDDVEYVPGAELREMYPQYE